MIFDFHEYIIDNFPEAQPQQMDPNQISIHCINPDCDDNWRRKRKMTVNVADKQAFCFKCGKSYKPAQFIAEFEKISLFLAIKRTSDNKPAPVYGVNRLEETIAKLIEEKTVSEGLDEPEIKKTEPCLFPPYKKIEPDTPGWKYLIDDRKFRPELIEHFGLVFGFFRFPDGSLCADCHVRKNTPAGRRSHCCPYANRIIIPIHYDGVAISFQGRSTIGALPKYLFPPEFGSYLYNWDDARYFRTIIITEGVTSAWRVWSRGYQNVTATFGKSLKRNQEIMIKAENRIERVIFLWDGGTLPEAYAAAKRLATTKEVLIAELPGKLDPDEYPDFPDCIENAKHLDEFNKFEVAMSKI